MAQGRGLWCDISGVWGHIATTFLMMQKYEGSVRKLFCDFCKLVGHHIHHCEGLDLMHGYTMDSYRVQDGQYGLAHNYNHLERG